MATTNRYSDNALAFTDYFSRIQQEEKLKSFDDEKKQKRQQINDFVTSGLKPSEIKDILFPQGIKMSVSHEHKVPLLENWFDNIKNWTEEISGNDGVLPSPESFKNIVNTMVVSTLVVFIILASNSSSGNSGPPHLRHMRHVCLSILYLLCIYATYVSFIKDCDIYKHYIDFFWKHLYSIYSVSKTELGENPEEEWIEMEVLSPQGLDHLLPSAVSFICILVSFLTGYYPKNPFVSAMINATKINPVQSRNISGLLFGVFSGISKFFKDLEMDNVASFFEVGIPEDDQVGKLIKSINDFVASASAGNLDNYVHFSLLYDTYVKDIALVLKKMDPNGYDSRLLMAARKQLDEIYNKATIVKHSLNGTRVEPVGILIKGPPGVHKSALCQRLASLVAFKTLPEQWLPEFSENKKDFIYSLPADKWYDGYTNKAWISLIDDVFQVRDIASGTGDSEAARIIKLINEQPFPLPMANVDSKNSTYFTSPFVLATTNLTNWNTLQSVIEPEAVRRRFCIELDVKVAKKYRDGRTTNYDALPKHYLDDGISGTSIPDDFWTIEMVVKKGNNVSEKCVVDLYVLVYTIIMEHHSRIRNFHINKHAEEDSLKTFSRYMMCSDTSKFNDVYKQLYSSALRPQAGSWTSSSSNEIDLYRNFTNLNQDEQSLIFQRIYLCYMQHPDGCTLLKHFTLAKFFKACGLSQWASDIHKCLALMNKSMNPDIDKVNNLIGGYVKESLDNEIDPSTGSLIYRSKNILEDKIDNLILTVKSFGARLYSFVDSYKFYILTLGPLLLGSSYFLYKFFTTTTEKFEDAYPQSADYSRDRARTPGKTVSRNSKLGLAARLRHVKIKSQVGDETIPIEDLTKVFDKICVEDLGVISSTNGIISSMINKYIFIMYITDGTKLTRFGHALNITGNVFAIPMHFLYQAIDIHEESKNTGVTLVFTTATYSTRYTLPLTEFLQNFRSNDKMADKDIVLFRIPSAHRNSKGILGNLLRDDDISRLKASKYSFSGSVVGTYNKSIDGSKLLIRHVMTRPRFVGDVVVQAEWKGSEQNPYYGLNDVLGYDGSFGSGDCGSLLIVNSNDFAHRNVIGFHVAGGQNTGYSTVFSYEEMMELLASTDMNDFIVLEDVRDSFVSNVPLKAQGLKKPFAELESDHIPTCILKTSFKRSLLYHQLPEPHKVVKKFPARLRDFEVVDEEGNAVTISPMENSRIKYGGYSKSCDTVMLSKAVESYEELLTLKFDMPLEGRTVVPLKEALHAFNSVKPISSSTSAGFPMSLKKHENLKKGYYSSLYNSDEEKTNYFYLRIAEEVENYKESYANRKRVPVYYKDTLKDELLSQKKIEIGKTRMFSGCGFVYLVLCRMYFGKFMSAYTDANIRVGSAIGINPYSSSWDDLARNLLQFSGDPTVKNIGAGDYKNYDADQQPQILWSIFDMIVRWYGSSITDEDKNIMFFLFGEIVNSRHVNGRYVYEWQSGIPSGNPMTALVNTIYNNIVFRIAFGHSGNEISRFNEKVYMIALGDDNLFAVSPDVADTFNELEMPRLLSYSHLIYTTELKGEAIHKFRAITEVEFLKRSFRFEKNLNRYVAPINMDSIFDTLNWTQKGDDGDQIAVDKATSSIVELTLHGKEAFNRFGLPLMELVRKKYPLIEPSLKLTPEYTSCFKKVITEVDFSY